MAGMILWWLIRLFSLAFLFNLDEIPRRQQQKQSKCALHR